MPESVVYTHDFYFEFSHGTEKIKIRGELLLTGEDEPIIKLVPITDGITHETMNLILENIRIWNKLNAINGDIEECKLKKK